MQLFNLNLSHPLVNGGKARCLGRFFFWQIKSRFFRRDFIHNWVDGSKFFVKNGETGLTQNIYVGLHEFEEMSFLLHLLRENDQLVDVGANSGSYSILGAAVVHANVLAIEPVQETFERLIRNLELNKIEHLCTAVNIGLGSSRGTLNMTSTLDTTNQIVVGESNRPTTSVQIFTLDEVANGINPTLIKMDVEGWELEVLLGARETLKNANLLALILELNESGQRYGFSDSSILSLLSEFDFYPYSYSPFDRSLTKIQGKNPYSGNTIFIRDIVEVHRRLAIAPSRRFLGKEF